MQPTDDLYRSCLALIHSVVQKQCDTTPALDYDELLSQASLIFCNAALSYDPSKGASFKTHLYNQLKRLSENVEHLYGPTLVRGEKQLLFSFDWYHCDDEYNPEQEQCVLESSTDYGVRLMERRTLDGLEVFREVLSEDGRAVYDAISSTDLDPIPSATVTEGSREYKDKCILTPIRLWRRRFKDLGWSLDRVRAAHLEVRRVIQRWRDSQEPLRVSLTRPVASREPLVSIA